MRVLHPHRFNWVALARDSEVFNPQIYMFVCRKHRIKTPETTIPENLCYHPDPDRTVAGGADGSGGMSPELDKLCWFPVHTSAAQQYEVFFNGHEYNPPPKGLLSLPGEDDAPRKPHFCSRCKSPSSSERGPSGLWTHSSLPLMNCH